MNRPEWPPATQAPDVHALLAPLLSHGVDFIVIGGMAGFAHGSSYPSYDLDVAYARDHANVLRLVAALTEIGVRVRGAPPDLCFELDDRVIENGANFTFLTAHGDFDILADIAGIRSYDELKAAAESKHLYGFDVPVASIDHLIAMKRAAGRTKDKLMLEEYIVIADEQRLAGQDQA